MIPLQLQKSHLKSHSRRASYVNRWEVVGNDKNQCVQMTRNDAEKSNHLRGGRRETINSYLKLKTYLKYKYLLILKCDFRWLSGDPADENTNNIEKEEGEDDDRRFLESQQMI